MSTTFVKMQGCGNDFLFVDCLRSAAVASFTPSQVIFLCDRNYGIGADGLVILQPVEGANAAWTFLNADGSLAEMCGNAARCAIRHLQTVHFPDDEVISLSTTAGIIRGRRLEDDRIEVTLTPRQDARIIYTEKVIKVGTTPMQAYLIDTGVPHAVIEVKDLLTYPVDDIGRQLLRHPAFGTGGANVTFFQRLAGNRIRATTFERGVERETLACGTGAAAAAFIFAELYLNKFPILVSVPGGELELDLSANSRRILLRGPAEYVMRTTIEDLPRDFEPRALFGKRKGS